MNKAVEYCNTSPQKLDIMSSPRHLSSGIVGAILMLVVGCMAAEHSFAQSKLGF
jgi:hypothetical protein